MTKSTQRKNIWISLALCVAAFVGALFCLFFPGKKVDASAASPTSGSLYWSSGAAMSAESTDYQRMRFILHLDTATHGGLDRALLIDTGTSLGMSKNPQIVASNNNGAFTGLTVNMYYRTYKADGSMSSWSMKGIENQAKYYNNGSKSSAYFEYSCLSFDDYAQVYFTISFNVESIYQDYTLVAGVYGGRNGENLVDQAVSDTRNLHYIWEKAYENNDEMIQKNPFLCEYLEFEDTVDSGSFEISPAVALSSKMGMSIQVSVPDDLRALLFNPTQEFYNQGALADRYVYTNYYLLVETAATVDHFLSGTTKKVYFRGNTVGDYTLEAKPLPNGCESYQCIKLDLDIDSGSPYCGISLIKYVATPYKKNLNTVGYNTSSEMVQSGAFYQRFSCADIARDMLSNDMTLDDNDRKWLMTVAGISGYGEEVPLRVVYKYMRENAQNYGAVVETTDVVGYIPKEIAYSKTLVESYITKFGIRHPSMYNVTFNGAYYQDGNLYNTDSRIVLQAREFSYAFHEDSVAYGELKVVYEDFQYKDLNLRITNNDWDNHLTMNWYTTDVKVSANYTTLIYKYDDIEEQLYNSCKWLFEIVPENITYNSVDGVTVTRAEDRLTVTCENAKVNNLLYLKLTAVAEILEDYDVNVTYKYKAYRYENFELKIEERESAPFTMLYSDFQGRVNFENFMSDYGAVVNAALECPYLEGTYLTPSGIVKNKLTSAGTATAEIVVQYSANPIFKITNNLSEGARYKGLTAYQGNVLNGSFFVDGNSIPDGFRISEISSSSGKLQISNSDDYMKTTLTYKGSYTEGLIIPVLITYTDYWNVSIDYMQQIEGTPFAQLVTYKTQVKVSDYDDIYALTKEDVLSLLPIASFEITGSVTVAALNIAFDEVSTYTVDLEYSHASLKQINYEGEMKEIQVPLTSYADWCNSFGKDWSILFLNTETKQYFKYSSDVARDRLYGLFSVAVFDEQVSDLNYYFKNATGDGQMTMFTENQVQGSAVYKFFDNLRTKGVILSIHGHVGMAFCELVNDENKIQYMHYFYLDGTNPNGAFVSNGGADNADDTDNAIQNKGEDIADGVKDFIGKATDSPLMTVLQIVLGLLSGVAVFCAAYWMLKKVGAVGNGRVQKKIKKKPLKKKGSKNGTKTKK